MAEKNFHVAPELSAVSAETLMTKAFELTHRIHEQEEHARRSMMPTNRDAWNEGAAETREQRDAIVREMARRTEAMERALVTVEVTERLMRLADNALADGRAPDDATRVMRAREALDAAMERTTITTCSLVKDLRVSNRIAGKARDIVLPIATRINEMRY